MFFTPSVLYPYRFKWEHQHTDLLRERLTAALEPHGISVHNIFQTTEHRHSKLQTRFDISVISNVELKLYGVNPSLVMDPTLTFEDKILHDLETMVKAKDLQDVSVHVVQNDKDRWEMNVKGWWKTRESFYKSMFPNSPTVPNLNYDVPSEYLSKCSEIFNNFVQYIILPSYKLRAIGHGQGVVNLDGAVWFLMSWNAIKKSDKTIEAPLTSQKVPVIHPRLAAIMKRRKR